MLLFHSFVLQTHISQRMPFLLEFQHLFFVLALPPSEFSTNAQKLLPRLLHVINHHSRLLHQPSYQEILHIRPGCLFEQEHQIGSLKNDFPKRFQLCFQMNTAYLNTDTAP